MEKMVIKEFIDKVFDIKAHQKSNYIGIGHLLQAAYQMFPKSFEGADIGYNIPKDIITFKKLNEFNKIKYAKFQNSNKEMSNCVMQIFEMLNMYIDTDKEITEKEQASIILELITNNADCDEYISSYLNFLINQKTSQILNSTIGMQNIFDEYDDEEDIFEDYDNKNNLGEYNFRESLEKQKGLYNINKRVYEKNTHVIGRNKEIEEAFTTLSKKVKANVLLLGEAGVGKTAVVEKMAEMINSGNVLDNFKNTAIYELSVNEMVAGTKYRGEFEDKIAKLLDAVSKENDVILFIDEIHNAVAAGHTDDSPNGLMEILKPFLSRGSLRVIGATTYDEYRKIFSKNKATDRRFEVINVLEPTKKETIGILKGIKKSYEDFHNIEIPDDCLVKIVDYSEKYISNKKFPDKAIDVLDYICARAKNSKVEINDELIKEVIEKMANVKLETLLTTEEFSEKVKEVIKGQDEAVKEVSDMVNLINLGIIDKNKPLASFLFTGPTGVGKTELARQIAKIYFGSESKLIKIDMSDYPEKHDVAKLTGATPGYVGYDDGSLLLNSVKKQPYSVILLDEVEKAHPDVLNIFLQILDDGFLTDAQGEKVDFRNTMIIMTSNLGSHNTDTKMISIGSSSNDTTKKVVELAIKNFFKPEFLNRIDRIIYFNKLDKSVIKEIAEQYMSRFGDYKLTNEELELVIEKAEIDTYGARIIQKVVRSEILPNKVIKEKASLKS